MNISFREMEQDEATLVQKIGRSSFGIVEQLVLTKPKNAMLAIMDNEIVGSTSYRIFPTKARQSVGYVEVAYIKKGYEDKGIGRQLFNEVTASLKSKGCVTVTALVRDDNVASWKSFENNGYNRITFLQMLQNYGLITALWLWIYTLFCFAVGHELWATVPKRTSASISQISFYLLLNLITLLPALRFGLTGSSFGLNVCAILALLVSGMLGGLIWVVLSKEKWSFRVARGGVMVSLIVAALGGVFPVVGRFYPKEYKRTEAFKRDLGLEGLFEWIAVLLLVIVGFLMREQSVWGNAILSFGGSILLYHSISIFPFGSFGGTRIWNYSKITSILVLLVSLTVLFVF